MQAFAESAVRSVLVYPADPDGAMTVIDPRTGFVRAMVGGKDADYWHDSDAGRVNLATGKGGLGRQTGSAFKPYALVAALESGISPSTVFPAPCNDRHPARGRPHLARHERRGERLRIDEPCRARRSTP